MLFRTMKKNYLKVKKKEILKDKKPEATAFVFIIPTKKQRLKRLLFFSKK